MVSRHITEGNKTCACALFFKGRIYLSLTFKLHRIHSDFRMFWEAINILWTPKCEMTTLYKNLASYALWIYIPNKTSILSSKHIQSELAKRTKVIQLSKRWEIIILDIKICRVCVCVFQEQRVGKSITLASTLFWQSWVKSASRDKRSWLTFIGLSSNSSNVPPNKTARKQQSMGPQSFTNQWKFCCLCLWLQLDR